MDKEAGFAFMCALKYQGQKPNQARAHPKDEKTLAILLTVL